MQGELVENVFCLLLKTFQPTRPSLDTNILRSPLATE